MSKFSRFMKENKVAKLNEKYAATASLLDENGEPLQWEFRKITSKENEDLRDSCTIDVQVKGKPNLYTPKVKTSEYVAKLIAKSTVYPDLYDKELQDSYGALTPEELLYAMVDDAGEYQALANWIQKFQGFTKILNDKVEDAKN